MKVLLDTDILSELQRRKNHLDWASSREVLSFDERCAQLAGEIGGALLRAGRPIGLVDVGLAATAIVHRRTLVTGNTAHFDFVRAAGFELPLENWREAG